jgi:hypothetical protein
MVSKRKAKKTTRDRHAGGQNRGYWYRTGRGWFVAENEQPTPLLAENGERLKDRETPTGGLDRAYARHVRAKTTGEGHARGDRRYQAPTTNYSGLSSALGRRKSGIDLQQARRVAI